MTPDVNVDKHRMAWEMALKPGSPWLEKAVEYDKSKSGKGFRIALIGSDLERLYGYDDSLFADNSSPLRIALLVNDQTGDFLLHSKDVNLFQSLQNHTADETKKEVTLKSGIVLNDVEVLLNGDEAVLADVEVILNVDEVISRGKAETITIEFPGKLFRTDSQGRLHTAVLYYNGSTYLHLIDPDDIGGVRNGDKTDVTDICSIRLNWEDGTTFFRILQKDPTVEFQPVYPLGEEDNFPRAFVPIPRLKWKEEESRKTEPKKE